MTKFSTGSKNPTAAKNKRSWVRSLGRDPIGYLLIAPFMLFTFIFVVVPIIANIFLSFTDYNISRCNFVGFKNYIFMFRDDLLLVSLRNTFVFTFFTLLLTMVLGLMIALLLQDNLFGISFFRTSFYIPYVTSMVAAAMIWLWMYEPSNGIINQLLGIFGIKGSKWLYDMGTALGAIIVMSIWKTVGYYMVIYISGLQSIPKYLYEAAKIDGASSWKRFWNITYPMLMPITFFLFVTGFINCFRVFEQVQIMTNGGPVNSTTTIVHQIYNRAFSDGALGYAAAEAVLLLALVSVITLLNFKFGNQGHDLEAA